MSKRVGIETRYDDRNVLDEVVAEHAHVHLEMMSDQGYVLIVETERERCIYWIGSLNGRSWVRASETVREKTAKRKSRCRYDRPHRSKNSAATRRAAKQNLELFEVPA